MLDTNNSTEWVSVNDDLPPFDKKVLVCDQEHPDDIWITCRSEKVFHRDNNKFQLFEPNVKITHWMNINSISNNNINAEINYDDYYPFTVVQDRYGGTYSNAAFLCFGCDYDCIPKEVNGSDGECYRFWKNGTSLIVGKGATPMDAIKDFISKYNIK